MRGTNGGDVALRRVLVDSRTPVNYAMVAPVVAAMAPDPRVRFSFTASETPAARASIYREAPAGTRLTGRSSMLHRWDAYVTSDFMWAPLPRGARRVQMFHGVGGKYGFDAPAGSLRDWHRLFFVNRRRLRNVVHAGAVDADSPALRLVGMPKVDCLVNGSIDRTRVLARLRLDASRPTVLYAPTWSPASSLNRLGVDLVRRLAGLPVNLIVKLHDRSREGATAHSGGVDWVARLTPLLAGGHTRLADQSDITPLLVAADVMITDHSSAGFEYLLLDRPLIRIDVPELLAQAHVHPDYVALLTAAAATARDVPGIEAAVTSALADPSRRSSSRQAVAADLFHGPGGASRRCAAALYELIELDAPPGIAAALRETQACEAI